MTHPVTPDVLNPNVLTPVQSPIVNHFPGGVPPLAHILIDAAITVADSTTIFQAASMQPTAVVSQENWTGSPVPAAVDVFVTGTGAVYVLDVQAAALFKYNSIADVGTNAIAATWGGWQAGTGNNQFAMPQRVVVDGANNIYVADSANNRIVLIDASNTWHYCGGFGTDHFNNPCGLALDGSGHLYVADTVRRRIVRIHNPVNFFQSPTAGDWQPYKGYPALQFPFSISIPPGVTNTDSQPFSIYVSDWSTFQTFNGNYGPIGSPRIVELFGTAAGPATGTPTPTFQTNTALGTPFAVWAGVSGIYATDQARKAVVHFTSITDQSPTYQTCQGKMLSPMGLCVGTRSVQA